ncbi:ANTAR domain-containing protein [Mycobacterium kyorinense]|uniref:Antitermination regulator n=1 Tax=Mycobacterium kyorinense TaxID=487514 RepID=A0A1X1Y444_9MYCO|nr:ANTAR domain-containing protein [Mycobacterium kyorinense]ORW05893.1 antitermination regulator [Mycobacterium kyorinense]
MMADWVHAQISSDPQNGRILDTAQGILIGLRRCSSESALHELLGAAQRHRMPVFAMAWALVHLAGSGGKSSRTFTDAQSAARHEWGKLFAQPAVSRC